MRALNGAGLETGSDRIEARKIVGTGKRDRRSFKPINHKPQAGPPNTAMADAFWRALMKWAAHAPDLSTEIVIPTGTVDAAELLRVVRALKRCAR